MEWSRRWGGCGAALSGQLLTGTILRDHGEVIWSGPGWTGPVVSGMALSSASVAVSYYEEHGGSHYNKTTRVRMFHIEMFCFQSIFVFSGICNWSRLMDGTSSMLLIGRDCNRVCSKGGIITDRFRAVEWFRGQI